MILNLQLLINGRVSIIFSFLCFLINLPANSQEKNYYLDIGLAKRFYPVSLSDKNITIVRKPHFSIDQYRDYNLSIDLRRKLIDRLDLQISGYLRYGHSHYQRDVDLQSSTEVKRLKGDLFLDVLYSWKPKTGIFKSVKFNIGLGYGKMNINTGYDYNQIDNVDSSGNPITSRKKGGFEFAAPRLLLGAQIKKFKIGFNIHGTPDPDYEPYPTIWNELKLSYTLFQF